MPHLNKFEFKAATIRRNRLRNSENISSTDLCFALKAASMFTLHHLKINLGLTLRQFDLNCCSFNVATAVCSWILRCSIIDKFIDLTVNGLSVLELILDAEVHWTWNPKPTSERIKAKSAFARHHKAQISETQRILRSQFIKKVKKKKQREEN